MQVEKEGFLERLRPSKAPCVWQPREPWQICLPLVKGTLIALGIFTFLGSWNDLFWPLIVLSDRNHLTLPAGLAILGQGNYQQRGIAQATSGQSQRISVRVRPRSSASKRATHNTRARRT